jgi:hypothetical protein
MCYDALITPIDWLPHCRYSTGAGAKIKPHNVDGTIYHRKNRDSLEDHPGGVAKSEYVVVVGSTTDARSWSNNTSNNASETILSYHPGPVSEVYTIDA